MKPKFVVFFKDTFHGIYFRASSIVHTSHESAVQEKVDRSKKYPLEYIICEV